MSDQGSYGNGGQPEWGRPPAWGEQPPHQPPAPPPQQPPGGPTWAAASQDPNDPYGGAPQPPAWGQQPPSAPQPPGGYGGPPQPQPGAPQAPGWGAAPQPQDPYGAPPQPQQYGAPLQQPYGAVPGGSPGTSSGGRPAEYGTRVVAYLIDVGIVLGVAIAGFILTAIFGAIADVLGLLMTFVTFVAYAGVGIWNMIILQGNTGQSIGKKSQGIKLVNETGQPLGPGGAFVRYLVAALLSSFTCGVGGLADILWPLFDEDKKRLTDKILKNSVNQV